MKKVFCKDCKWFEHLLDYTPIMCRAKTGETIIDYVYGHYQARIDERPGSKRYPNDRKTNGCTYYKRRWWKWWVKEEECS